MGAMIRGLCLLAAVGAWLALAGGLYAGPPTAQGADFFERSVRPVLADNCWKCHGPGKQMGGLRLDSRAALLRGGDSGPAVQPGDGGQSLLVQALRRSGELKMPPKKPLSQAAVAALETWVKMGAPWPADAGPAGGTAWRQHWAFQPVRDRPLPAVKDAAWPRTSVDRFILAALEARGLTPSPAADRRTLLRRVTFDLIGLPPTPAEFAAFEADPSPDAYERVVDRLLASPHYGERWGRHWLDVARYADTKGYVFFEDSPFVWAWTYRDWVLRAFNEDLPYDRFVLEQLAADQLPLGQDRRALAAMGFLTVGGRFMNNVQDILDDRIDVVCRGLLGLTVSCARCHDHKFDPIPTADYYSLYGVFASSIEPDVPPLFAEPPKTPQYERFQKELLMRERKLAEFLHAKHTEVTAGAHTRVAEYLLAAHAVKDQPDIEDFMLLADGGDLNPAMIKRWKAFLARTRKSHHPVFAPWHQFAALPEKGFAARARAIGTHLTGVNPILARALAEKPPTSLAEAARRYSEVLNAADRAWQEALKLAAQRKSPPPTALSDPAQEELRQVFHAPDAPPNVAPGLISSLELLPDRPAQAKYQELRKAVDQWRATGPGAPPRALILVDAPEPYQPNVFLRGNPANLGPAVPRQFLSLLTSPSRHPFAHGSGRLEMAQAIVDPKNPLTARVFVSRVWLHHFGQGLVRTPSDIGLRSEPPSHPELLDHLAATFVREGWSVKSLHRRIVLSAAYGQRSDDRPDCRAIDQGNRMLWRAERRRLDFEALLDALLSVAGRLDPTVGGPSVNDLLSPAARRRTLYGYLDRLQVPGLYRAFDFPSPDSTSPQRDATTIPQQALFLMNHPFVLECARRLVSRPEIAGEKDFGRKATGVYRLLYGRAPTVAEVDLAKEFLGGAVESPAWARYAQGLLMANEFAFVD
jgi:hypothetical protein